MVAMLFLQLSRFCIDLLAVDRILTLYFYTYGSKSNLFLFFQADNPSYDQIQKMEYLDMVWCETLRKYPLAST